MTFTERAKAYASAIAKGEIDACRLVRLSCQRFLDDIERKDWKFKPELVERVCGFAELNQIGQQFAFRQIPPLLHLIFINTKQKRIRRRKYGTD